MFNYLNQRRTLYTFSIVVSAAMICLPGCKSKGKHKGKGSIVIPGVLQYEFEEEVEWNCEDNEEGGATCTFCGDSSAPESTGQGCETVDLTPEQLDDLKGQLAGAVSSPQPGVRRVNLHPIVHTGPVHGIRELGPSIEWMEFTLYEGETIEDLIAEAVYFEVDLDNLFTNYTMETGFDQDGNVVVELELK